MRISLLAMTGFLGLAACGDPFPEDFTLSMSEFEALGFAKPTEFTDDEILSTLRSLCSNNVVTEYKAESHTDGTKFFGARCEAGYTTTSGSIYVTRTPSGRLALDLPPSAGQ